MYRNWSSFSVSFLSRIDTYFPISAFISNSFFFSFLSEFWVPYSALTAACPQSKSHKKLANWPAILFFIVSTPSRIHLLCSISSAFESLCILFIVYSVYLWEGQPVEAYSAISKINRNKSEVLTERKGTYLLGNNQLVLLTTAFPTFVHLL